MVPINSQTGQDRQEKHNRHLNLSCQDTSEVALAIILIIYFICYKYMNIEIYIPYLLRYHLSTATFYLLSLQ